jgi:hypothetical protein
MVFNFGAGFARGLERSSCWLQILLLAAAFGLYGCGGTANIITGESFRGLSQHPNKFCDATDATMLAQCTPALRESLQFAQIGTAMFVELEGSGTCKASVDFGDGTPPLVTVPFHVWPWLETHTYNGWPGKKLVRVKAESGCLGDLTKEITVGIGPSGREDFSLALCFGPQCTPPVPITSVCNVVTPTRPMPPIRKGSGVRIETDGHKVDYGSGKIFDAGGDPSSPTPSGYLFPHRRKFSLVYRIGTTDFQGEAGPVTFIADQTAPLEVCVNDNPSFLTDNTGAMLITITVNERSAQ